jgi:hypothetical protein
MIYTNFEDMKNDFIIDKLTPQMLKSSLTKTINELLEVCNEHVKNNPESLEAWNYLQKLRNKKQKKKLNTLSNN